MLQFTLGGLAKGFDTGTILERSGVAGGCRHKPAAKTA